ncbi:unnamed protein product [Candidula unifasciata]|uniref:CWH43-like N-terminal domain-containing protein n=1 Tax=Candidula unifasciata TaxID=100452 RepID=A0A8S4A5F5_9EUPU|nr:unnamed protein product [Candidula unifasciata]
MVAKIKKRWVVEETFMKISMWPFALVTVALPAISLAVCFITAYLFRFDEVNETMCNVRNFVPSISAVTGITPQAYLWRTCIALHSAPRFALSLIHYNYYVSRILYVQPHRQSIYKFLIKTNFWINFIENSCLVLVAYITNRENYPVHEKIFIVFMVTSVCYMLLNTILFNWSRNGVFTETEKVSYWWKKAMFVSISIATAGLLFFFYLHRIHCVVGAFSMFSVCEYVIGYTNMAYNFTAYLDFKHHSFLFAAQAGESHITNGVLVTNNNIKKTKHH